MNKELQDLAWSVLPKEFKEEVKRYFAHYRYALNTHVAIINHIFGLHNLTSDVEGEEMLYVSRKRVQGMYAHYDKICNDPNRPKDYIESVYEYADGVTMALDDLFGSKCLPDNVDSLSQNPPENCDNGNLISTDDNKPAGPKFKLKDRVVRRKSTIRTIVGIDSVSDETGTSYYYMTEDSHGNNRMEFIESDLEPYTEPGTSHETPVCENHSDNTSQKEVNMNTNRNLSKDCDKHFDNILKDSFSKECRLNIAVHILSGIIASSKPCERPVKRAIELTDALIAECEKGGRHDN